MHGQLYLFGVGVAADQGGVFGIGGAADELAPGAVAGWCVVAVLMGMATNDKLHAGLFQ